MPSLDGEIWKPIPDRPGYEVSSLGRVKSLDHMTAVKVDKSRWGVEYTAIVRHHGRIIKQQVVKGGYMRVSLGTSKCNLVARLVLRAFVGDPPPGDYEAAHSDGNPQNNTLANLAWKTPKENTADKRRHGTMWRPSLAITQCKHGHDLTDSTNVYIRKDNAGRMCRQCKRRRDRAYKLTQRVAA